MSVSRLSETERFVLKEICSVKGGLPIICRKPNGVVNTLVVRGYVTAKKSSEHIYWCISTEEGKRKAALIRQGKSQS